MAFWVRGITGLYIEKNTAKYTFPPLIWLVVFLPSLTSCGHTELGLLYSSFPYGAHRHLECNVLDLGLLRQIMSPILVKFFKCNPATILRPILKNGLHLTQCYRSPVLAGKFMQAFSKAPIFYHRWLSFYVIVFRNNKGEKSHNQWSLFRIKCLVL